MQVQTRGIILRQTRIMNDKRMLVIFTERFGKISVASGSDSGRGRTKSSLAYKPFTLGNYDLYKVKDTFRMGRGETVKSYYKIGENVDKYLEASFVLEFTDKLLVENEPVQALFNLLSDYFEILERRTREYSFLTTVYMIKAIQICGYMPRLGECVVCGKKNTDFSFYIEGGGAICRQCAQDNGLIYKSDSDIIDKIVFISRHSIKDMEKIYLETDSLEKMNSLIRGYTKYHLDISDLKSEHIIKG
ncbi:MAG: DNA repair protein RecO [Bacillota bacterium]|nr:DNA repair protein RecO [Bacillota bacterium]